MYAKKKKVYLRSIKPKKYTRNVKLMLSYMVRTII